MSTNRVAVVEANLDSYLAGAEAARARLREEQPLRQGTTLTAGRALQVFEDQLLH